MNHILHRFTLSLLLAASTSCALLHKKDEGGDPPARVPAPSEANAQIEVSTLDEQSVGKEPGLSRSKDLWPGFGMP